VLEGKGAAVRVAAPILLLAAALGGCGGGGSKGSVAGTLPACASAGAAVSRPAGLADFPLPRGGVLGDTREDAAGSTVYEGFLPGGLGAARDYFKRELPKHGYTLGEGDAEEHEAEADFSGHGVEGHFKLSDEGDCDGAVRLAVALR
jgi:hypothetical protein